VVFFFIETRGVTLEEVAKIFDGEDAEVAHVDLDAVDEKMHRVQVTEVETVPVGGSVQHRHVEKV
jgi:hypothetical protein